MIPAQTEPESLVAHEGRRSPFDYVENLKRHVPFPQSIKVLAHYSIASSSDNFVHSARDLLVDIKRANEDGFIEPPLNASLANEIDFVLKVGEGFYPAAFLVSWALSEEGMNG